MYNCRYLAESHLLQYDVVASKRRYIKLVSPHLVAPTTEEYRGMRDVEESQRKWVMFESGLVQIALWLNAVDRVESPT